GGLAGFGFAVACKEVAAMLPLALLLADLVLLPAVDPARWRRVVRLHAPFLAAIAVAGVLRFALYRSVAAPDRELGLATHLLTQAGVAWLYLRLFLWPAGQSLVHQVSEVRSLVDASAAAGVLAAAGLVALAVAAFRLRRRDPPAAFGVLWFL